MQTAAVTATQPAANGTAGTKKGKGMISDGFSMAFGQMLEQTLGGEADKKGPNVQVEGLLGLMMAALPSGTVLPQAVSQPSGSMANGNEAASGLQSAAEGVPTLLNLQLPNTLLQVGQNGTPINTDPAGLQKSVSEGQPLQPLFQMPQQGEILQPEAAKTEAVNSPSTSAPLPQGAGPQAVQTAQTPQTIVSAISGTPAAQQFKGSGTAEQTDNLKGTATGFAVKVDAKQQGGNPTIATQPSTQSQAQQGNTTSDSESQGLSFGSHSRDDNTGKTSTGQNASAQASYQAVQSSAKLQTTISLADKAVPQTSAADVARQISNSIEQAVRDGHSELRLHLSPEDLGGISVKIVSHAGALSLQITAENAHTGSLIAGSINDLSSALGDKGISLDRTEVLMSSSSNSGSPYSSQTGGSYARQQQQQGQSQPQRPVWVPAMEQQSKAPSQNVEDDGRLSFVA